MMPRVSLQILIFKESFEVIDRAIQSMMDIDYPADRLQIVLLSNYAEGHDTYGHVQQTWMNKENRFEIVLLRDEPNSGFAGGHQHAYEGGMAGNPDYIYLLNADGHLDTQAVREAVRYMEERPKVAIAQSRIMLEQEPELLNSCGNHMHYLGFGYSDGYRKRPEEIDEGAAHFYASGAGVTLRASALEEIGGMFDPSYFLYHEDVDVSWRARLAGYDIGYAKDSVMYHDYEFASSIRKFYWMERNRFLTHFTHLKWRTLLLVWPLMKVMELGTLVYALKSGWFVTKLNVYLHFFKPSTWSYIRSRRRLVRSIRRVDDRELLAVMVPTIEAQEVANVLLDKVANPVMRVYYRFLLWAVRW